MPNIRLPQTKTDSTGDVQYLSGYVVVLRDSPFTTNTIIGTEVDGVPGYYDFADVEYGVAYQRWAGTSLSTLSVDESFSDEDGKILAVIPDDTIVLDANDLTDDAPYLKAAGTAPNRYWTGGTGGGATSSAGVDYLYVRGTLVQHNDVQSGKAFFGSTIVALDTGIIQANIGTPEVTIADSFSRTMSSKLSTGIYALQFRTNNANNFVESLAGLFQYKFEPRIYTVWGSRQIDIIEDQEARDVYYSSNVPEVKGYLVFDNKEYFVEYSDGQPLSTSYYQAGKLIIKTYDENWVLADEIIEQGVTIEIRAFESITA